VDHRTRDLCGPRLRPCEGCGGTADYARAEQLGWIVARCAHCGRQTGPCINADSAAKDWNHRITDGARLVTLSELWDLDFAMGDDRTDVAVWIEGRDGALRAAVLSFGIDLGEPVVREYGAGMETRWRPEDIAAEGVSYRLWDRKPTSEERRAQTAWAGPAWKDARQLRAEAMVGEALGR